MLLTVFCVFELHPQSPTVEIVAAAAAAAAAAEDGWIMVENPKNTREDSNNEITITGSLLNYTAIPNSLLYALMLNLCIEK